MGDDRSGGGRQRPANDNRPPDGQNVGDAADAFRRLDTVVLTIARLIGRRMAREDYEKAMCAANDNAPAGREGGEQDADEVE